MSPTLRTLMLFVLYALPLVVALRPVADPVLDPDIWWHLAVGRWIVEQGTLPDLDPFSQTIRPWVAYSWLYELLVYQLHETFGLAGVIVYRAVLSLAIVASLHSLVNTLQPRFLPAVCLTGAASLALGGLFSERPWLFTILFAIWTLHTVLLFRQRERVPRIVWLLPLVFVLWANIHIQVVYGLFILALGCLPQLLQRWEGQKQLVLLTVLCAVATLITPFHLRLYFVVLEYATQPGPFRFVNELRAMEFREIGDWVVLIFFGASCFVLGRRRNLDLFEIVLLVVAAWFAFRARRDLWFLILASLVVLARPDRPGAVSEDVPEEDRFSPTMLHVLGLSLALILLTVVLTWQRNLSEDHLQRIVATKYPARAVEFVKEKGYAGPLFNDFNWGGYLIWSLPEYRVSMDGRTNLHGDERIIRYGAVWSGQPGWRDDEDLSRAGVVIASVTEPLAALLKFDPRFKVVHEDDLAYVFVARRDRR